jgi:hypothetical protein
VGILKNKKKNADCIGTNQGDFFMRQGGPTHQDEKDEVL